MCTPQQFYQILQRLQGKTRLKLTQLLLKIVQRHRITRHYSVEFEENDDVTRNPKIVQFSNKCSFAD